MARRFTRREFHDLVWSKPIVQVARDFGLSDVAVHKICRKHGIPTPPPGWWAKQRAGKRVRRIELPQTEDEADVVVAASDLGDARTGLAAVREEACVRACRVSTDVDGSRDPVVRRTLAALGATMPWANGVLRIAGAGLVRCEVGSGSIERVGLILSRLAAAAAAQGFALDEGERGARFAGAGEALAVDRFGRLLHGLEAIAEVDRGPRVSAILDFARCEFEERGAGLSASDVPAIALSVRPMLNGWYRGERTGSGTIV